MRIGIFGGDPASQQDLDRLTHAMERAEQQGFPSFWLPQIFGFDTLTALAAVAPRVPRIAIGTAVVPTYPRHPIMLASQALTVQAASGGRLTLGIGLSHQIVIESMFGLSFERPGRHMREYLAALLPMLHTGAVDVTGETVSAHAAIRIDHAPPPDVVVAALGPRMLRLAGTVADGTITWMTGPATLAEHTVPSISKAASDAGRPAPRVVVGLPVCVTDDPAGARERGATLFQVYGSLPSYRAMLDREGAAGPADIAIVGDEDQVRAGIERVRDAGATDFVASEFGADATERARTRDLLRSML